VLAGYGLSQRHVGCMTPYPLGYSGIVKPPRKAPAAVEDQEPPHAVPRPLGQDQGELYRLLVESVRDYAIFALDPDGYILSWNAGAQRFKGYTAAEVVGQHFSIFYPRELVAGGFPEFELRTAANTGRFEDEGWRIRKDGSRFWANVVITALRNERGELTGFAKVTRDLTERREAEEALRESEERFRLIIEGVRDYAIFMLDLRGNVATWNSGAERLQGYRAKEIIGSHFSKFYPAADVAAGTPEQDLEAAAKVGKVEQDGWRVRKDGATFWANVLITPLNDRTGKLIGYVAVTRDLTERRAAERRASDAAAKAVAEEAARRAADDARSRADEANSVKSQFLAAMSHELRTPLNAIGGYTDLISMGLAGPVTPQQMEHLVRIKRSQEHLLGIINDILNFSRVEAGQLSYDLGPLAVHEVVHAVMLMIAPQAHAKGLSLTDAPCEEELMAWADTTKVDQILLNLLSNAVKFTSAGGKIVVSCAAFGSARVAIRVRDTGRGIPAQQLEAIFEPFVQVGRSLIDTREGTGLGLAISRDLARAMHGDIIATSTVDVGSEFTLLLPTRPDV
jgi:PAS domain S-box-containing protein